MSQSPENVPSEEQRACNNDECGWIGQTDRMCGGIGPLCPDCGETTTAQDAAPATVGVPDGWKLVPVNATKDMAQAANGIGAIYPCDAPDVWSAMLAASPTPPAGEGQEPVLSIYAEGTMRTVTQWLDGARDLSDGDYKLYTRPAPQAAQPAAFALKDHEIAEIVNQLRDIALEHGQSQQLRERIARVVVPVLKASAQDASKPAQGEPLVRYCPGCGRVGEVGAEYRNCCPDGAGARTIPQALAKKCHDTFQMAIGSALSSPIIEGDAQQTARLDFLIENQAWVQWTKRDGSITQCQVWNQDEDEINPVLSGDDRYFNTPREAIDAAIAAMGKEASNHEPIRIDRRIRGYQARRRATASGMAVHRSKCCSAFGLSGATCCPSTQDRCICLRRPSRKGAMMPSCTCRYEAKQYKRWRYPGVPIPERLKWIYKEMP